MNTNHSELMASIVNATPGAFVPIDELDLPAAYKIWLDYCSGREVELVMTTEEGHIDWMKLPLPDFDHVIIHSPLGGHYLAPLSNWEKSDGTGRCVTRDDFANIRSVFGNVVEDRGRSLLYEDGRTVDFELID